MIAYAKTAGPFEPELRQVAAVMVRTTERDRATGEVRPAPPRLLAVRVREPVCKTLAQTRKPV